RIAAHRLLAAPGTGQGVLPRFDHRRRDRRQVGHLTPTDSPAPGPRQGLATPRTRAWATVDDHIRLAPRPAEPDMPALRPQLAAPTPASLRLLTARRWHRRVLRRLHGPPELRQLSFQLPDL